MLSFYVVLYPKIAIVLQPVYVIRVSVFIAFGKLQRDPPHFCLKR